MCDFPTQGNGFYAMVFTEMNGVFYFVVLITINVKTFPKDSVMAIINPVQIRNNSTE